MQRLATVFAYELRLKLVSELYMREMSPSGFLDEFGGGSIARVDRHIKVLVKAGWLRLVGTQTGDERRGGIEHFYRATELAIFDHESWDYLPYSIRVAFSWRILNQYVEKVRDAIAADTFGARPEALCSHQSIRMDERGWRQAIKEIDAFFVSTFEEQKDAWLRMRRSKEEPITVTVALVAFEAAGRADVVEPVLEIGESHHPTPFTLRLSRVLTGDLGLWIVREANEREISAPLLAAERGGRTTENTIRRHFRSLVAGGWLAHTNVGAGETRRGAQEKLYRAVKPEISEDGPWSTPPPGAEDLEGWRTTTELAREVREALRDGTFDHRSDRYFTWTNLRLDQTGWKRLAADLHALRDRIQSEAKASARRLRKKGAAPVEMRIGLSTFEAPAETERLP